MASSAIPAEPVESVSMWLSPRSHFVGEGKRDAGRIEGRDQCKTYLSRGVEPSSTPSEDRKTLGETFWAAERGLERQAREVGQCKRMNVAKSSSQVFWKFFKSALPYRLRKLAAVSHPLHTTESTSTPRPAAWTLWAVNQEQGPPRGRYCIHPVP